jgi:hypothetical protein
MRLYGFDPLRSGRRWSGARAPPRRELQPLQQVNIESKLHCIVQLRLRSALRFSLNRLFGAASRVRVKAAIMVKSGRRYVLVLIACSGPP